MRLDERRTPAPAASGNGGSEHSGQARPQYSTAAPADNLLARLDRYRETGPGRWIATCPAHDDKNPSLTIRETSDGTLLLKCWAGCSAAEVVAAIGLEMRDLFPAQPEGRGPLRRGERWVPRDVLRAVASEATVVALAAGDIVAGRPLSAEDRERVQVAAGRLRAAALEVCDDQ